MNIWNQLITEKSEQEYSDFEIFQPLVKQSQTTIDSKNKQEFEVVKSYGKKMLSTLLIFIGTYLTYAGSLTIFHVFLVKYANISNPLAVFLMFLFGLILTILGVGRFERKRNWLLYLSVPLMSLIIGFVFILFPVNWHGKLFGGFSLLLFPLILLVFYSLKERFESE